MLALIALLCGTGLGSEGQPPLTPIAVVVGRDSFIKEITKGELREVYLRHQRVWPNGSRTIPVNLPPSSPLRERFSRAVLGRGTQDLVGYWRDRYSDGVSPPAVLTSPAAIRTYLTVESAAIAYLPATEVDASCRVLLVLDAPEQ